MIPKFRAWIKNDKKMKDVLSIDFETESIETENEDGYELYNAISYFPEIILMQSTGLKDSNGVEIYEGDVIEWSYWVGDYEEERGRSEIKVFDGAFRLKDSNDEALYDFTEWAEEYYVVGNVYENPELLEGE